MKKMPSDKLITVVKKNQRECISVAFTAYHGHELVELRLCDTSGSHLVPTGKFITFGIARIPELITALRKAEKEVRRLGLLKMPV